MTTQDFEAEAKKVAVLTKKQMKRNNLSSG